MLLDEIVSGYRGQIIESIPFPRFIHRILARMWFRLVDKMVHTLSSERSVRDIKVSHHDLLLFPHE